MPSEPWSTGSASRSEAGAKASRSAGRISPETSAEASWEPARLSVPRGDRQILIRPALAELSVPGDRFSAEGLPWPTEILQAMRCEDLWTAAEWTGQLLDHAGLPADHVAALRPQFRTSCGVSGVSPDLPGPIVATGHQPELFHPGVWIKHLAVSRLARQSAGIGLNLIVDNDLLASRSIAVPAGSRELPRIERIPFDAAGPTMPWEDATVTDENLFETFGDRVTSAMSVWGMTPLAGRVWTHVRRHRERSPRLSDCLSAGRICLEHQAGFGNLELPLSMLCETEAFRQFAATIISDLSRWIETYNATLREYRQLHRIRSATHPVPALQTAAGFQETPFWIWRAGDTVRSGLFVRHDPDRFRMATAPREDAVVLDADVPRDDSRSAVDSIAAALRELGRLGFRVRSRALATTMFARVCLSDLFIHGIGGAKYDEMTDRIISRMWGVRPPEFVTLSATVWLPLARPFDVERVDIERLRHRQRDIEQNPQRYLDEGHLVESATNSSRQLDDADRLVAEKHDLINEQLHSEQLRTRLQQSSASTGSGFEGALNEPASGVFADGDFDLATGHQRGIRRLRRLREINRELNRFVTQASAETTEQLADAERQLAANSIFRSREFSFCLYPDDLPNRLAGLVFDAPSNVEPDGDLNDP